MLIYLDYHLLTAALIQVRSLLTSFLRAGLALNPVIPLITSSLLRSIQKLELEHPSVFGSRGATGRGFGFSNCAFATGAMIGPIVSATALERLGWGPLCLILATFNAVGFVLWVSSYSSLYQKE